MSKLKVAWKHIKTLKGSNYGVYYCGFTDSGDGFEIDEIVMDEFLDNQLTPEETNFLLMSEEERVNTYKNYEEIWKSCVRKLEVQRLLVD